MWEALDKLLAAEKFSSVFPLHRSPFYYLWLWQHEQRYERRSQRQQLASFTPPLICLQTWHTMLLIRHDQRSLHHMLGLRFRKQLLKDVVFQIVFSNVSVLV